MTGTYVVLHAWSTSHIYIYIHVCVCAPAQWGVYLVSRIPLSGGRFRPAFLSPAVAFLSPAVAFGLAPSEAPDRVIDKKLAARHVMWPGRR